MTSPPPLDPFAALGLPATPMLADAQVREAWRAIAAATHPDRADGGDPAAYAAASAAYAMLRGPWSRTEAYADLLAAGIITPHPPGPAAPELPPLDGRPVTPPPAAPAAPVITARPGLLALPARVRHGRPARLAARILAAAAAGTAAWLSGAGTPAVAGTVTLAVTWAVLTARGDLAPPPGR